MNTTDTNSGANDYALAYAAISLCGNKLRGPQPQWHEIEAWRTGKLTEPRASEVLSHVANDPLIFQQWLDICDAELWAEEERLAANENLRSESVASEALTSSVTTPAEPGHRPVQADSGPSLASKIFDALRSLFQQPIPVYGGAFAAIMMAVLIAPLLRNGDALNLQQQLDRSSDAYIDSGHGFNGAPPQKLNTRSLSGLFDNLTPSDVERLFFQAGMRQFHQQLQQSSEGQAPMSDTWQNWLTALPNVPVDCSKATDPVHCAGVKDDFFSLGQWSLMNAAACQSLLSNTQIAADTNYWSTQYRLYDQLRTLPSVEQSQVFSPLLAALSTQTPESLCAVVTSIVATGQ